MVPTHGWVCEFHEQFGIPSPHDSRHMRWRLLREEAMEVKEALAGDDRAKIAKELADLVYQAYGAAILDGINLDEAIRAVHASNMTKTPGFGSDGKVQKGPGYEEADLSSALAPGPVASKDKTCPTCEGIKLILEVDSL